jgi:hypothetical protein
MIRMQVIVIGLSLGLLFAAPPGCVDRRAFVNLDPWFAPPAGRHPAAG